MKWNWYEDDFTPQPQQFNYPLQNSGYFPPQDPVPPQPPPSSGGGWWETLTRPNIPAYDPDAWYNEPTGLLGIAGQGIPRDTRDWINEKAKPWIKEGYEKIVAPASSYAGLGLMGLGLGGEAIGALGAMDAAAVGASKFAPILAPATTAAKAAVAASETAPGLLAGNAAKLGLAGLGATMGVEGLKEAGSKGLEFFKNPSNELAAQTAGGLAEAYMGWQGTKHGLSSLKARPIDVPPPPDPIQLGPDTTPQRVAGIQADVTRQQTILQKAQSGVALTKEEAEVLAQILPARRGDPFIPPKVPTYAEAAASFNPQPYFPEAPISQFNPISPTAVTPGEIGARTGSLFDKGTKAPAPIPAPGVQVPAPPISRMPYGPERPPLPAPEIPLEMAQASLDNAAKMQRAGDFQGARDLRLQVASSVRNAGYGDWAATIESQAGSKFKGAATRAARQSAVQAATPPNLDPNFNQGFGDPELAGSTPSPRTPGGPLPPSPFNPIPTQGPEFLGPERPPTQPPAPDLPPPDFSSAPPRPPRGPKTPESISPEQAARQAQTKKNIADYEERVRNLSPENKALYDEYNRINDELAERVKPGGDLRGDANREKLKAISAEQTARYDKAFGIVRTPGASTRFAEPTPVAEPVKVEIPEPPAKVEPVKVEPIKVETPAATREPIDPSSYTTTRAQIRATKVAELDAKNAPDADYKAISFNDKAQLKPGETWRGRVISLTNSMESAAVARPRPVIEKPPVVEAEPAPPPSKFEGTRPETAKPETFYEAKAKLDDRAASGEVMKYEEELAALKTKFGVVEKPKKVAAAPAVEKPKPVKPVDDVKIAKQKSKAIEEGYDVVGPEVDIGKQPVLKTFPDGSRVVDPRSEFAPKKPEPVAEPSKFQGTRPETQIAPPTEMETAASESVTRREGAFQSERAQELSDKMAELDEAGAPDAAYKKVLSAGGRGDKLLPGETWKGRVTKAISYFEEEAATRAGSPYGISKIFGKEGQRGSIFVGKSARTRAKQAAIEMASREVEPVPESKFGLSPSEMRARQQHGVSETGKATPTRKVTKDWMEKAERPKRTVDEILQTAWNKKRGATIRGVHESKELKAFDKDQNPFERAYNRDPGYQKLRDYFTRTQRVAKEAGLRYEGTLAKMFGDEVSAKDIEAVFGKPDPKTGAYANGSKKPNFSFDKIFEDMETGRKGGLTPKFDKPTDLVSFLENEVRGKVGRDEAFRDLRDSGHIRAGKREDLPNDGRGWKQVDPNIVPGQLKYRKVENAVTGKTETVPVEYWAEARNVRKAEIRSKTYDKLDAFYKGPNEVVKTIADFFAFPKNIFLSGGVPWTSANKHAWNLANRALKSGGTPELMRFLKANEGNQDLRAMIEHVEVGGLSSSAEDVGVEHLSGKAVKDLVARVPGGKFVNRRIENLQNVYEKPLFKEKLPSFKTESMKARIDEGMKAGLTREQAIKRAADIDNVMYGGISETRQGWLKNHPNLQQGARIVALAPDWLQTKVRLGGRELKSLAGMEDPAYLKSFARGTGMTLARRGAALALGKAAYDQYYPGVIPTGTQTETEKGPKRARGIDLIGTSDELQRLAEMAEMGYRKGDFRPLTRSLGVNQANLPVRTIWNLTEGKTSTNEPLWTTKGKFGKPVGKTEAAIRVMGEISQNFTPPVANAFIRYAQGMTTMDQLISEAGEGPLVFHYIDEINKSKRGGRTGRIGR